MDSTSSFSKQTLLPVFLIVILALTSALGGGLVTGMILSSETASVRLQLAGKTIDGDELLDRVTNGYDVDRLDKSMAVLTREVRSLEKRIDELQQQPVHSGEDIVAQQDFVEDGKKEFDTDKERNGQGESEAHPGKDPILELDEILDEASDDSAAVTTLAAIQDALNSMVNTSLDVLSTTCSAFVCRIDFQYRDDSDLAEAQRELTLKLGWDATYIVKTEPVPGVSNKFESILYIDKRPSPGA